MNWRVGLIDSCGGWPGVTRAAAFVAGDGRVARREPVPDPIGHGTRIAQLMARERTLDLRLGQVFTSAAPTTGAAVAAAVDWAVNDGANLIHLSLGLAADRPVLSDSIARALGRGVVVVAAAPARGAAAVYPAAYPGVIRGTGDARCAPGELAALGEAIFGACPRLPGRGTAMGPTVGGASIGAAWLTWSLIGGPPGTVAELTARLIAAARYHGAERRAAAAPPSLIASQ